MEYEKNCGCKGIRTCLICEKDSQLSKIDDEIKETAQYEYCLHCNLCWPLGSGSGAAPLFLGKLTLVPEFITEEEEKEVVAAIDSIDWMPSQSGRRKQDFGPKVNFKKKKGRIGNFKGFPRFTEDLIKRLWQHRDLSDFHPVELCHLDYDPARGSAIEPHLDDTWIWGERLVTLNLASPTVLTFTLANTEESCDCHTLCLNTSAVPSCEINCNISLDSSCSDCSPDVLDSSLVDDKCTSNGIEQDKLKEPLGCESQCIRPCPTNAGSIVENNHRNCPVHCDLTKDLIPNLDIRQMAPKTIQGYHSQCLTRTPKEIKFHSKLSRCSHERSLNGMESKAVEAMCSAYRIGHKESNIEVLVPLPARSLVVVAGCSRHNWFHEIKRKDIVSRRLAMTFRELAENFTSNGSNKILGDELLELGRTFLEMNT